MCMGGDASLSHIWMSRLYVWHDSLIYVTWLVGMCDMTRWYGWHDSFICVTWLVDMFTMDFIVTYIGEYTWLHPKCISVTILKMHMWLLSYIPDCKIHRDHINESCHTCERVVYQGGVHSNVWHDSWISATPRIHRKGGGRLVRLQWFCPSFFFNHKT